VSYLPLLDEEGVQSLPWPDDVIDAMARETWNVLEDLAATDDHTRRTHESFMSFLRQCDRYAASFDTAMLQLRHRAMELL
jgi:TRAP-type mannitol/chloroaromatic compound transport system substrate-binding protein